MYETTIGINAGSVEYAIGDAAVSIDELIEALEAARSDGATHVVGYSGNHRGPKYVRLSARWDWVDDDDEWR